MKNYSSPLGLRFAVITKLYYGALSKKLEHTELNRYYSVLSFVAKRNGTCTQQDICNELKKDKVSMVRVIDTLSKEGFVQRQQNPNNRREYYILLTSKGKELIPQIDMAYDEIDNTLLDGLNEEEKALFFSTLDKIDQNMNRLPQLKMVFNLKKANK